MAGTTAPRRKRAKQTKFIEDDRIPEIEDAADNYVDARNERMGLTEKEVEAKTALILVMKKHKRAVYKGEQFTITCNHKETDDVKVQMVKDPEDSDDDE